jgi:hypothetical protein
MKNLDVVAYLCMDLELAVTRSFTLIAWWSERFICVRVRRCPLLQMHRSMLFLSTRWTQTRIFE